MVREPPADPVLTGVSVIDALTTLVRGQKLPIFSVAGLPHLELAAQIAAQASRRGGAVQRGLRRDGTHPRRRRLGPRPARGAVRGRRAGAVPQHWPTRRSIERILTPRIALTVAEHLAFDARPSRAGRHGRHDQLLRGAPRGVGGARRDPGPAGLSRLPLQRPGLAVRAMRADPGRARLGDAGAGADHARQGISPIRCPTSPGTSPRARSSCPPTCTREASTRRSTCCPHCRG